MKWTLPCLSLCALASAPAQASLWNGELQSAAAAIVMAEFDYRAEVEVAAPLAATTATRLAIAPVALPLAVELAAIAEITKVPAPVYRFGPFEVTSSDSASLVAATDAASPDHFSAMLRAFPDIDQLVMVEAPGTYDDRANLELGRMIHQADLATIVPAEGSVRSGAVELFLAGTTRIIEDGAEFAVHSWRDDAGLEASDYAADAVQHRAYLEYYSQVGLDEERARAFYDMTNSVPHEDALWLDAAAMRSWVDSTTVESALSDDAELTNEAFGTATYNLALLDVALLDQNVLGPLHAQLSKLDLNVRNI